MTRKRDLSGFAARPATAPTRPTVLSSAAEGTLVPLPPRQRTPVHSDSSPINPPKRKPAVKQRITLSLPTRVATMLRSTADAEQRIFLDIILTAFVAHAEAVESDLVRHRSGLNPSGSRRRAGSGRTQIPLNILKEDLEELDHRVKSLNIDRSAYVTELLIREIKG